MAQKDIQKLARKKRLAKALKANIKRRKTVAKPPDVPGKAPRS